MLRERIIAEKEPIENIRKMFEAASADVSAEIFKWFVRFANNNGLSLANAKKALNSDELKEFKKDVFDYIEMGRNNQNGAYSKELENMSARVHISRYEAVMFQIQKQIDALAGNEETNLRRLLEDTYRETYYRNIYEYEKGTGIGIDFSMLDQDEINLVLDKPWAADGKHFSERIWGDRRAELVQEINKSLRKMLVTGENPVKLAPEIKKKFNVSERQAERLLRTEDAYFAEEATYNSYKECGTEEYEIIATLDYKTSEICQEMDGKHFPVEEKKTGVNYPPFHPNCRTTTAPYIDDPELTEGDTRIARNSEGKNYYVPANMTYKEWYESLGSEERAAFVRQSKMDKNRKTDKEQYERYKKVLGKENVPKTFDKWQDLKYNDDKAEYEDIKHLYHEVNWQIKALENHTSGCVHTVPFIAQKNSVFDNYDENGILLQRRYYGRTGKPRLDIDMTDHGNPKKHKVVPHYHIWTQKDKSDKWIRDDNHDNPPEKWHIIANKDILSEKSEK